MAQKFVFVRHIKGTSNTSGEPYDMVALSNGLAMLPPLGNPKGIDFSTYKERDELEAEVEIDVRTNINKETKEKRDVLTANIVSAKKLRAS